MQLPDYPSRAHAPVCPDRLATVARLHGLDPPRPATARVLELGCGAAVNLLAIAVALPGSSCVGVDVDPTEIEHGRRLADAAGLRNVELICADLRQVEPRLDVADYVLAHGVWSWVDEDVRAAVAGICARKLSAAGVALISYNAFPGWHAWMPARELALQALRARPEAEDGAAAAREALALARELHGDEADPYGGMLAAAAERYDRLEDPVLARDDLAERSQPFWLEDVVRELRPAGLRYLGEALADQWWQWRLSAPRADRIRRGAGDDSVARQQLADFAAGPSFKASLFVPDGGRPALEPDPRRILELHAAARSTPPIPPRAAPIMRVIADQLLAAQPFAVAVTELARRCGCVEREAAEAVLRLAANHRATVFVDPPPVAAAATARPTASALVRAQARSGATEVSSLLHEQVPIEEARARELLPLLDGSRDHVELAVELTRVAGLGRGSAPAALERYLARLAKLGILAA